MRSVAIDLGEDSVKIVELGQTKKSLQIQAVYEKKLSPQSSTHDRDIESIEFIREYVRTLNLKKDSSQTQFVMAVPQSKATVRKKNFPFSDRLKIQKSLSFEMEEDIPFDPDNCIFDFKTIQYVGNSADTLAVAVPKTHIEKIVSLAKDFGIDLKIVTLEGFAFANLIENWWAGPPLVQDNLVNLTAPVTDRDQQKRPAEVFLNIGHRKTIFCARMNGRVVFIRSLMWGADYVIQEMVKRYQYPYIEAQRMLQADASLYLSKATKSFEEINLATLVEKSLRDLVRDLQMSFLELESEFSADISSLFITGGFGQLPNLGAFLTQQLEVPCNPVNLLEDYMAGPIHTTVPENSIIAKYSTAVGIAIESFKKPRNPSLQFLKGDFVNQNSFLTTFWKEWGGVLQVGAAAMIVLFSWAYFRETFSLAMNEKATEVLETQAKGVARLTKRQANEKGVAKYISDHRKRVVEMRSVSRAAGMQSALDVLKKISEATPGKEQIKIDVVNLSIFDDQVKISGYVNSPRELGLLSEKLSGLSTSKSVKTDPANLGALPNKVAFALSFQTDRGVTK